MLLEGQLLSDHQIAVPKAMNTCSHPTPSPCTQQYLNSCVHPFHFGHPATVHTSKQGHGSTQHTEEMMNQNHLHSDEWKKRMFCRKHKLGATLSHNTCLNEALSLAMVCNLSRQAACLQCHSETGGDIQNPWLERRKAEFSVKWVLGLFPTQSGSWAISCGAALHSPAAPAGIWSRLKVWV